MRDGTAVILAAGYSKRFGGDKRKHEIEGTSILRKTIEAYLPVFPTPIVVVRADDDFDDAIPPSCKLLRIDDAHLGMSRSLEAGVKEAHDTPWLFVGLCDMPFVKSATLSLMKWVMDQGSYGIVRPRFEKKPGNPVAFSSAFYDVLQNLEGDSGARDFLQKNGDKVHHLDVEDEGVCVDIDTQEDVLD